MRWPQLQIGQNLPGKERHMTLREVCTKGRRGHEFEEGRKRGSSGIIHQTYLGHVARVGVRGDTAAPLAKGFIYVLRPSILIKSVWFLHHHGGRRVESLLKNDNGHGGGFAVRQVVTDECV